MRSTLRPLRPAARVPSRPTHSCRVRTSLPLARAAEGEDEAPTVSGDDAPADSGARPSSPPNLDEPGVDPAALRALLERRRAQVRASRNATPPPPLSPLDRARLAVATRPVVAAALTRLFVSPGLVGSASLIAAAALGIPLKWEVSPEAVSAALAAAAPLVALDAAILLPDFAPKLKLDEGAKDGGDGPSDAALARSLAAVSDLSALTGGAGSGMAPAEETRRGGGDEPSPPPAASSPPPPVLQPEERAALLKALAAGRAAALESMAARGGVLVGVDPSVAGVGETGGPDAQASAPAFRLKAALHAFAGVLGGGSGRLRPPAAVDLAIVAAGRVGTEAARAVLLTALGRWTADRIVEAGPDAVDAATAWAASSLPASAASLTAAAEAGVVAFLTSAVAAFGLAGVVRGAPVGEPTPRAQAAAIMRGSDDGEAGAGAGPAMLSAVAEARRRAGGGGGSSPAPSSQPKPSAAAMAIALTTRLARAQADAGGVQAAYQAARLAALSAAFLCSGNNLAASTAAAVLSAVPVTALRERRRARAAAARAEAAAAFKAAMDAPDVKRIREKLRAQVAARKKEREEGGGGGGGEGGGTA